MFFKFQHAYFAGKKMAKPMPGKQMGSIYLKKKKKELIE